MSVSYTHLNKTVNNDNDDGVVGLVENGRETDQSNENKDDQVPDNNVSESHQEITNFMELLLEKQRAMLKSKRGKCIKVSIFVLFKNIGGDL